MSLQMTCNQTRLVPHLAITVDEVRVQIRQVRGLWDAIEEEGCCPEKGFVVLVIIEVRRESICELFDELLLSANPPQEGQSAAWQRHIRQGVLSIACG